MSTLTTSETEIRLENLFSILFFESLRFHKTRIVRTFSSIKSLGNPKLIEQQILHYLKPTQVNDNKILAT